MNLLSRFRRRPQKKSHELNDSPNLALEEAQQQFAGQGLPFPYIPQELAPGFTRLNDWLFGSGHNGIGLYDIGEFALNAQIKPQEDYLLLGQAGHGRQSYAMHYYLAQNPLYLFLQIDYGGVYTDQEEAIKYMARRFEQAERIIKSAAGIAGTPRWPAGERWIITSTDFYTSSWIKTFGYHREDCRYQDLDESTDLLIQILEQLDQK